MPAVQMTGVSKTYRRRGRTAAEGARQPRPARRVRRRARLPRARTARARRRRSACCSAWSPPTADGEIRLLDQPVPEGAARRHRRRRRARRDPAVLPQLLRPAATCSCSPRPPGSPGTASRSAWRPSTCATAPDDKFKGYSLGMKQRLGIAAALLKAPQLLILDEPSNGLDPAGIRDVRELIRRLGRDGHTTVLLSSHLLAEIQQVADHVTILARGRCVATGPVDRGAGRRRDRRRPRARARPAVAAARCSPAPASASPPATFPDGSPDWSVIVVHAVATPSEVTRLLAEHGHYLDELLRRARRPREPPSWRSPDGPRPPDMPDDRPGSAA